MALIIGGWMDVHSSLGVHLLLVMTDALLENDPECMNNSRYPEKEAENEIDEYIHIARILLKKNGKWWDENGQNEEK